MRPALRRFARCALVIGAAATTALTATGACTPNHSERRQAGGVVDASATLDAVTGFDMGSDVNPDPDAGLDAGDGSDASIDDALDDAGGGSDATTDDALDDAGPTVDALVDGDITDSGTVIDSSVIDSSVIDSAIVDSAIPPDVTLPPDSSTPPVDAPPDGTDDAGPDAGDPNAPGGPGFADSDPDMTSFYACTVGTAAGSIPFAIALLLGLRHRRRR